MMEHCISFVCFVPLNRAGLKFFGFSEFLAALALLVLAWTNADARYRFRVATAPVPIYRLTFVMVLTIGVLTLFTDLWRAESRPVPSGDLITPAVWQALLGAMFLANFALWIWFAFIKPPVFSRWNSFRFANTLYGIILKGKPDELSVVAEEFYRSVNSVIAASWKSGELHRLIAEDGEDRIWKGSARLKTHAHEIIQMIADKKFCKQVIQCCPATAQEVFASIAKHRKYDLPIGTFAKNITTAAIENKNSFAYNETDRHETGYFGHHKPISKAIYGNSEMVDGIGQLLDVAYRDRSNWDAEQWEAFHRLVLLCLSSKIKESRTLYQSRALNSAICEISDSVTFFQFFDDVPSKELFKRNSYKKLQATVEFIRAAIKLLDGANEEDLRIALYANREQHGIFRAIAEVMSSVVFAASSVKSPSLECWSVQYNVVWGNFFSFDSGDRGKKAIHKAFFRLLLHEIKHMDIGPNYKGAAILGMLLNVMGFEVSRAEQNKRYAAFHRAVLMWTKRNFSCLYNDNPEVVESCLPDAISYDHENFTLVKTYEKGLSREPPRRYLKVDPPKGMQAG